MIGGIALAKLWFIFLFLFFFFLLIQHIIADIPSIVTGKMLRGLPSDINSSYYPP